MGKPLKKTKTIKSTGDKELDTITFCVECILDRPQEEIERIVSYLYERFAAPPLNTESKGEEES